MEFEEALKALKEGKEVTNDNWNGNKIEGKQMYLRVQKPDGNSMNTEPYIMMITCTAISLNNDKHTDGWETKRLPWLASQQDLFSDGWRIR